MYHIYIVSYYLNHENYWSEKKCIIRHCRYSTSHHLVQKYAFLRQCSKDIPQRLTLPRWGSQIFWFTGIR